MSDLTDKLQKIAALKSGVSRLTLTEFRNYAHLRIDAPIAPVIISGENGSGKTNILEAISFLTPGRGLRNSRLAEIKRIHAPHEAETLPQPWSVAAQILKNGEEHLIGTSIQTQNKEDDDEDEEIRTFERRIIKINQQKITQQSELGKYISAIWLTPQMDRLFLGGAQPRRSFLDRLVYAFDLEHAKRTANFEHLYKQWVQLLKSGHYDIHWLESLEADMATIGVAIAAARREQIARLNTFIESEPDDVFPSARLELKGTIENMLDTHPAIKVEDFYAANLSKQRNTILYNESADGINRSDFRVYMQKNNMPAEMCSTGEQKALLINIILAQTKCQILHKGFAPILLLDEVATHLDEAKRDALLLKIAELNLQAWITSTEENNFRILRNRAFFLKINNGIVL